MIPKIYQVIKLIGPWEISIEFEVGFFKLILVNGGWGISYEIAIRWMLLYFTDNKSTLVQVMAWCRQATSHTRTSVDQDLQWRH